MAKKSAGKSTPPRKRAAKKKKAAAPAKTVTATADQGQERATFTQTEFIKRHDIADEVQKACQEWENARAAAGRAVDKRDTKHKNMVAIMKEHGVDRCPIQRSTEKGTKTKLVHVYDKEATEVVDPPKDND